MSLLLFIYERDFIKTWKYNVLFAIATVNTLTKIPRDIKAKMS
jgi:hypothetical protein